MITRRDLPLGSLVAQVVHAAGESARLGDLPPDTHAVVLAVEDEGALADLERRLVLAGVAIVAFREPALDNSLTAIGLVPTLRTKTLRKILGAYALLHALKEEP